MDAAPPTARHLFDAGCPPRQVVATQQVVVENQPPPTVHTVPIYLYKGSRDDMTGFLFDMVRPEEMIRAITINGSL